VCAWILGILELAQLDELAGRFEFVGTCFRVRDVTLAEFDVGDDDREAVLEEIASYQGAIVTAAD
jgi:hypothetical protein